MDEFIQLQAALSETDGTDFSEALTKVLESKDAAQLLTESWKNFTEEKKIETMRAVEKSSDFDLIMLLHTLTGPLSSSRMIKQLLMLWKKFAFSTMLEPLLEYISHAESRVRADAVEVLELIEDERVHDILKKLSSDRDNRVRANAAKALWVRGDEEGFKMLRRMLKSPNIWMRSSASYAIACIDTERFMDVLTAAADDESPSVREKIVHALSKVEDEKAYETLFKIFSDISELNFIRIQAEEALMKSSSESWKELVREYRGREEKIPEEGV